MNAELQELAPAFLSGREPVAVQIAPGCWPGSVRGQPVPKGVVPSWVQGSVPCAVVAAFRESAERGVSSQALLQLLETYRAVLTDCLWLQGCTSVVLGNKANAPLAVEISLSPHE